MARESGPGQNRFLAFIAALLATFALRETYPVSMPLAVALVVIAVLYPVKIKLDRILPAELSYFGAVLVALAVLTGFGAAVYFSAAQVVRAFADHSEQLEQAFQSATAWMQNAGARGEDGFSRIVEWAQSIVANVYAILFYFGFIALLVVLGLAEVPAFQKKISDLLDDTESGELIRSLDDVATKIRQYLGVTTATSVMTGVASTVFPLIVGLDLALVWGLLNFLLNFIPVVGNLIGILPPTLYAIVQFQNWTMPLVVLVGFSAIQIVISNFVEPQWQGRSLSLSPLGIVLAIAFWSWVWGIAGGLIAVPLTVALVIACQSVPSLRWIAVALSRVEPEER